MPPRIPKELRAPGPKSCFGPVLAAYCTTRKMPAPVAEYEFHAFRKWAFDFAWPEQMLALEIEGGTRLSGGGRHNRAEGYANDCEKYTEASLQGWRLIRVTWDQVYSGRVYGYIDRALADSSQDNSRDPKPSHA